MTRYRLLISPMVVWALILLFPALGRGWDTPPAPTGIQIMAPILHEDFGGSPFDETTPDPTPAKGPMAAMVQLPSPETMEEGPAPLDPKNIEKSERLYARGCRYAKRGMYGRAVKNFTQAVTLNPDYFDAYLRRGIAYSYQENHDLAIASYLKAIQLNPLSHDAYFNRGISYEGQRNFTRAVNDYFQAIQLEPRDPQPYNALAWVYATCENPQYRNREQALEMALKATLLDDNPAFMDTLAAAYVLNQYHVKAVETYLNVMDEVPEFIKAYQSPLKAKGRYPGEVDGTLNPEFIQTLTDEIIEGNFLEADWNHLPLSVFLLLDSTASEP